VPSDKIDLYLEVGQKRTFAGALDWPGWCRSGKDEESALQMLFDYGPRYQRVVGASSLGFQAPKVLSKLVVVERLKGNATTDFGAPAVPPSVDSRPVDAEELHSFEKILNGCWRAFTRIAGTAGATSLRSGPRGGGRQVEEMIRHVLESNGGYLNALGWKPQKDETDDLDRQLEQMPKTLIQAVRASARGEIPPKGPRGGTRWTARYFVRRTAWHILDHAWEIEDRLLSE
jgi:hypothetical protein